jgi:hypothetical protein
MPSRVQQTHSRATAQAIHGILTCLFAGAVFCALEPRAHAYIDPGSGLLVYQSMSAMFAGMLFCLRRRIASFFSGSSRSHAATTRHDKNQ